MEIRKIKVKPLTKEGFSKFGQTIESVGEFLVTNQGISKKWNDIVELDMFYDGGTVNLSILKTKSIEFSFHQMERHNYTSQIFIPLNGKKSLVAVAPISEDAPNPDLIEIFLMGGNQGVSFSKKVWHHTLFPLDGETEYILMARGGFTGQDVEIVPFLDNICFEIQYK